MKKLVFLLFGLLIVSAFVFVIIGIRKFSFPPPPRPIYVTEADRNTPTNLLDKKQDRNYVTTLSNSPKMLQIQGVISSVNRETFSLWSQKTYVVSATDTSVIECRDKFIKLADGSLALAYSTYLDLSKYVATLQTNRDTFLKQGKLFLYKETYKRIEPDTWVTGVFQEQEGRDKKYLLDVLLVYGCK
ncbi:MAG: hypothetical protein Q8L37_04005 [Candidatus Gottesmanbacteria bacterium]|nr:hypothetical protein [Candidatus Gottesmanbacteria bacterium]